MEGHRHSVGDLPVGTGAGKIPDNALMDAAIAAAIAGLGLLRVAKTITFADSPYTMSATPGIDDTLYIDTTGGPIIVNLPPASAFTPAASRHVQRRGPNLATLQRATPADNVNGAASYPLHTTYESAVLESDSTNTWSVF